MTALALLESLHAIGVSVGSESGRLIVEAPAGVVTEQLREELVRRKPELITALEMGRQLPGDVIVRDARNTIAELLSTAYLRHREIQRVGADLREAPSAGSLASSGVSSVHGGVP